MAEAATNGTYPVHARTKMNRKKQRGAYDYATIHSVLSTSPILNVAFAPTQADPFPTILPMIGVVGTFPGSAAAASAGDDTDAGAPRSADPAASAQDVYLHGYVTARLMNLAKDAQLVTDEGIPVCVSGTSVDGLIFALTPFSHSMNYRSAVVHGYATPVTDADEKLWAMERVTEHVCEGRWKGSRTPPTSAELASTGILKVAIVSASAKVHVGGPSDEKKDREDAAVRERVWTGTVPTWFALGEPVVSEYNQVKELPEHLSHYIRTVNERNERTAREAIAKSG